VRNEKGDCAALPAGDCAALPTGDRKARSHLGAFYVRFPFGKILKDKSIITRVLGDLDISREIAKQFLWAIALSNDPPVSSQGKFLNLFLVIGDVNGGRSRSNPYGRSHL